MNTVQRIAKNTGVLLFSQVISYLLGFFYVMYTARYLKVEGFGILSFALAFTGIFGIFADFGLGRLIVREVARDKSLASKYLANISVMKFILAIITFGLIALVVNLLGYPKDTVKVVYLIALSVILTAFTRMLYSIFQAFEKMEYQSLGQILNGVLMLLGVIVAIKFHFSVIGFAFIYFIASLMVLGYNFIILRWKFTKLVFTSVTNVLEIDWSFWKPTIKEASLFFLSAVFSIVAFKIDIVMLSIMKGDEVVGWYGAACKLIEVLMFVPATFVASIYPILSGYHVSSQESLRGAYEKSFKYLSLLGLPFAVGTTLLADKIILIIYRSDFANSIEALQVLVWTVPVIFLTFMFGTMLASINRQGLILITLLLCMLLNITVNLMLIPRYSYIGSSIATVGTELLSFILCYHFLSKLVYKIPIHKFVVRPAIASIIMGLFIFYFAKINFFILVCTSSVVYFLALIILRTFSAEDYNLFKQIFGINQIKAKK